MSTNHPSVVVISGPEAGTDLAIDEVLNDFAIGSDDDCHLTLSGEAVSPLHASLFLDDEGAVTVSDTKSRTGVFVNGTKVTEQTLNDGDEISLGPVDDPASPRLRFVAHGSDAPLIDLSGAVAPAPLDSAFEMPALDLAALMSETPGLEPLEEGVPEFAPLELEPDPVPPPVDEFPAPEMLAEAEPEPLPEPEPIPPAKAPAPPRVDAGGPGKPPASLRKASAVGDDPLAGLAESLGGDRGPRSAPPPPVADSADAPGLARKPGGFPVAMAARLAVIAAVLGSLAWFGTRRYSESIVVPVVDSYLPNPAEPGQTVTINGSGFGAAPDPTTVEVLLGSTAVEVLDAISTRLNITVPESLGAAGSQTLPFTITAGGGTSSSRLLKIAVVPKVSSLTPRVALSGDEVTIAGLWLANAKTQPTVTVAGNEAEILESTPASVRIRVPRVAATEGQKISVRVAVGSELSKEVPLHFGRVPFVDSVSPERAFPGDVVTVAGLGLTGPDLSVVVGGRNAVILSSNDTELKVSLPGIRLSDGPGQRDLRVQANQRFSAAHPIEILRDSSALYSPRFFVELTKSGRTAVSSELGPVMVLGVDAASRERAHAAATRLNALVGQGRTTRVEFTSANLVISGPRGPVLILAGGDGTANLRTVAALWAAQLTDIFDLFLQGRRPGRSIELSPDGKVFLDIFAAARRRSNEPGVPQGILFSLDPAWQRSLAAMASSPVFGSGQSAALLDGYWSGAIEVPGAIQPRKIEISLTATLSGLVGQRTSRQGRLSTAVTLGNLSYSNRQLRFSFVDSGENLNYAGRIDGDVIEGNVTKSSGARVGKLTLKLTR